MDPDPLPRSCNICTKGFVFVLIGLSLLLCVYNISAPGHGVNFTNSIKLIKHFKAPRILYGAIGVLSVHVSEEYFYGIAPSSLRNFLISYNPIIKKIVTVTWHNSKYF